MMPGKGFRRDKHWPGKENLRFLCPPDGPPSDLEARPSPPITTPFLDPLFIPSVKLPVPKLAPPPEPKDHQLYDEFPAARLYELREEEFRWRFHSEYGETWSWGFDGSSPGPTFHARYGEPVLVRRTNDLQPLWVSHIQFALPSTTTHNHNGHHASESDGDPSDWIGTGDFWDHHYPNFPASRPDPHDAKKRVFDEREKLSTLWYHDHRMDFTAANVYAGLFGFYLLFDQNDSGDETDPNPAAWRLPSGEYDIPLVLMDLLFDQKHQLVFDGWNTHGVLGDRFTVNRRIQPHLKVQRRKYRFRILNGGPSRFYMLRLHIGEHAEPMDATEGCDPAHVVEDRDELFTLITGDGNFLPEPLETTDIYMGVAQRVDVIIDFAKYKDGEHLYLENRLEQHHGMGPSGRTITDPDHIRMHRLMRFDVVGDSVLDPSKVPAFFRAYPSIDLHSPELGHREWTFDFDGGVFTINGMPMDPNRIDAQIPQDSSAVWTYRNNGTTWHHPIHSHLMEWIVTEVNGIPILPSMVQISENPKGLQGFQKVFRMDYTVDPPTGEYVPGTHVLKGPYCGGLRRDIANLGPKMEIKLFLRWPDFLGKYVIHCHNVVHEDYAMMARWDVIPSDKPILTPEPQMAEDVYGVEHPAMFIETRPAHAMHSHAAYPFNPVTKKPGFEPSDP